MRKRVAVLTLCVRVCVCEESTAQDQSLYDKLKHSCRFFAMFSKFPTTKLSEVISFTSYRSFRSFFDVVAFFLHDELLHVLYAHAQAGFCMEHTISHMAFLEFALLSS